MMTKPFRINHLLITLLAIALLLPIKGASGAIFQEETTHGAALLRVELPGDADLGALGVEKLQVYTRIYKQNGGMILLLPAEKGYESQFARLGYSQQILEGAGGSRNLYLLYGLEQALAQVNREALGDVLIQEGRQAVAFVSAEQAIQISTLGIAVQPLKLHTLVATKPAQTKASPENVLVNPLIQRMIDQVESSTLYNYVGDLSGEWSVTIKDAPYTLTTRYTGNETASTKATRYIYERFNEMGLPNGYHTYWINTWERRNVLAQQDGLTQPDRIVLLTAHLDSISPNPQVNAPGADDNASGSAGVLAIADILRKYPFGCSLRYALFTGEELGLYGSEAYAVYVYSQGENIAGVLNLDMIGYNSPDTQRSLELHTRPGNSGDLFIANQFASAISSYQLGLYAYTLQDGLTFSDHSSFWDNGYPAILAIEDWTDHTPSYHQISDRLSTLDMDYYTRFTKAALATFAQMGCLLEGELSGMVRQAESGSPIAGALIQVSGVDENPWTTTTQADGSYNLPLYQGNYEISVSAAPYLNGSALNVAIIDDQTTVQDFSLQEITARIFLPLVVSTGASQ